MFAKVKFEPYRDHPNRGRLYINGIEIHNVRNFEYRVSADEIPQVNICLNGIMDVDTLADTTVRVPIENVNETVRCLEWTCRVDGHLKDSFIERIQDVLDSGSEHLAEDILDSLLETEITDEDIYPYLDNGN